MNWKLGIIAFVMLATYACSTESEVLIEKLEETFEEQGFERRDFYSDGDYFERIIIANGDGSFKFFNDLSRINHSLFLELQKNSKIVKYVAGDPTTYFFSSEEVFERLDKFLEGTNPKLDDSGSGKVYKAVAERTEEAARILPPTIQPLPGGWDWAGSSIKMWQTENYQGAQVDAMTSWLAASIEGFQGGVTGNFVGITVNYVNAHLKTPGHFANPDSAQVFLGTIGLMEDDAESIKIDNWSTRDLRVQFFAVRENQSICGLPQTHLIVDVPRRRGWGHFTADLYDLKNYGSCGWGSGTFVMNNEIDDVLFSFGYDPTKTEQIKWVTTSVFNNPIPGVEATDNGIRSTNGQTTTVYSNSYINVNGSFECAIGSTEGRFSFGLGKQGGYDYKFNVGNGVINVLRNNTIMFTYNGGYKENDVLMVQKVGPEVHFYKNSYLIGTLPIAQYFWKAEATFLNHLSTPYAELRRTIRVHD